MHPTLQPAWQLYYLQRYPMALAETLKYLAHHPECVHGHVLLALIHGKESRRGEAVNAARAAIKYAPGWSYPYYVHALISYWFDAYQTALDSLNEAMKLNPCDADYFSLAANIHAANAQPKVALEMAEKGLEHNARHLGCLVQMGATLFSLDRKQEAEVIFRDVLSIDAEQSFAQGYVGYFEVQQGRYDLALPLLRNALRDQPHWGLAQRAWREALRGQYPVYGSVARLKQWLFEVHKWRVFAVAIALCMLIIGVGFYHKMPGVWQGLLLTTMLGLFAATFLLLFVVSALLIYMGIVSSIMLARDPDLRRKVNYRPETPPPPARKPPEKSSPFGTVMFVFVILVLLTNLFRFLSSRPR